MIQRIKPLPLAVVLQGSEAKQVKEKYTALTFRASNYIFTQTVTSEVIDADEPTTENRIVKTRRAVTRLPGANITKPPPLAVVILLVVPLAVYQTTLSNLAV